MVRLKNRYLLFQIHYPQNTTPSSAPSPSTSTANPTVSRTLAFHAPSPDTLTPKLLLQSLRDSISLYFGDYGSGIVSANLSIKYLSPATSTGIVRCARAHYRLVWAALTWITGLPTGNTTEGRGRGGSSVDCVVRVVRVSGTIKKVEEECVRRARALAIRVRVESEQDHDGGESVGTSEMKSAKAGASEAGSGRRDVEVKGVVDDDDDHEDDDNSDREGNDEDEDHEMDNTTKDDQ